MKTPTLTAANRAMKPKVVSLFAGIGGFDLGLERAGFEVVRQVEIDAYCLKVLEKHWPHVDRGTDVRKEESEAYAERYGAINLVCGGFPCQDLSLAGKRAGLAGERSGLFFELARIADAVPSAWVLAENVPGLLSSAGGADFATVLGELSGFFPAVPEEGWRNSGVCAGPKGCVAWRVLDAQYFGVAQRRRRVFIVRSPGGAGAFEVLFEPDCLPGNPPPSREAREGIARCLTKGARMDGDTETFIPEVACALAFSQTQDHYDASQQTYIASTLRSGGEGGIPSRLKAAPSGSNMVPTVVCGFQGEDLAHAVRSSPSKADKPDSSTYVIQDGGRNVAENQNGQGRQDQYNDEVAGLSMVRRLTPTECERLQGFPDGWTLLDGKTPDSPRYRALGNAVCVNVAEWIGKRIAEVVARGQDQRD